MTAGNLAAPSDTTIDPALFRSVMSSYPTGVTILTAETEDGPVGMTANSFTSVSLDPPMVLFCAALSSTTWPRIEAAGRFVVNFMSERGMHLVNRFAMPCADRFENVPHRPGAMGHPVLSEADAYLECELERAPVIGDHAVALGRVVALGGETADSPIIFHRRQLRAVSPLPA